MPAVATEYSCPTCRAAGAKNRIFATDGALTCQGNSSHRWVDVQEFRDSGAVMEFTVTPPKVADTTPRSQLTINCPTSVKTALETKYAGRLEPTIIGFLTMMAEGEVLAIPASDLKFIGEKLGGKPQSSGELKGMIYSAVMDKDTAVQNEKVAAGKLEAFMAKHPGMVVVNLQGIVEQATEQARNRDMTLEQFVETSLRNGIEGSWF